MSVLIASSASAIAIIQNLTMTFGSGQVIVRNGITFSNTTDSPTIVVEDANLTLRDVVVEETAGGDQAAIEILGGSVDLGTVTEPGGNTLVVNGAGQYIDNQTAIPMLVLGNTYMADDTAVFSSGDPVVDMAGNVIKADRNPYQEGMVFRQNLDGSGVEMLGWNFRNNWEVCVDSFGTLWQSDNDDDGNRGVRINYVMEFGNFGYRDESFRHIFPVPY